MKARRARCGSKGGRDDAVKQPEKNKTIKRMMIAVVLAVIAIAARTMGSDPGQTP